MICPKIHKTQVGKQLWWQKKWLLLSAYHWKNLCGKKCGKKFGSRWSHGARNWISASKTTSFCHGLGSCLGYPFAPGSVACNFSRFPNFGVKIQEPNAFDKRRGLTPSWGRFARGRDAKRRALARRRPKNFLGQFRENEIVTRKNKNFGGKAYFCFASTARRAVAGHGQILRPKSIKKWNRKKIHKKIHIEFLEPYRNDCQKLTKWIRNW